MIFWERREQHDRVAKKNARTMKPRRVGEQWTMKGEKPMKYEMKML